MNQIKLNYIVEGPENGLPLLLLHGATSRLQAFAHLAPELSKKFRVYSVDLRGHGRSDRASAYKLQDYVADIANFIDAHIKKPTVIFGNSFGGMVAIMLAARQPELVSAIIIGDAPLNINTLRQHTENQRALANQVIHLLKTKQIKLLFQALNDDYFANNVQCCDPEMLIAMFDQFDATFSEYDVDKLLPQIQCPILIIRGNDKLGGLISDADMTQVSKLLPNLSQVKFDDVGHSIMDNKPRILNEINKFINSL